nr:hypothetical protein [Tanacetum cinerariifolium]
MPPRRLRKKSVKKLVKRRVAKAIEEYEKTRADSINAGGSGSSSTGGSADVQGSSYKTFMNCKPHSFNGTKGVGRALTWWNRNVQTLGLAKANQIPWSNLKAMMTTEYCPATEIQKMEQELWTLTLKGDDIEAYNNRFHELPLMCPELVPTERKNIEKYVHRFPERIKGNITSSKTTTLHDPINMDRELVEQAVQDRATRIDESNKRNYEVELADGKVVSTNTVLRGCTLALYDHHCYEKIVRIPLPNGEILEVQGERPEKDLGLLACIKADEKKLDDIQARCQL